MSSNFWSRSRSLKGLNHLVDDAFLKIDESKKDDIQEEQEEEKLVEEKPEQENIDIIEKKDSNEGDEESEKETKIKKVSPYYDPYFFEDVYLKNTEYSDVIKTASISGNKYRPNLEILEKLLKMEDLTRILVLQLVGDHDDFLSLEDYFANPLVLCKLLDYILDPRYCIEEADESKKDMHDQIEKENSAKDEKEILLSRVNSTSSTESMDLIEFYRCAVTAVDVLVIDINAIAESFLKHDFLIKKLWSMLDKYPTLANDASTAFLKINERLLQFAEMSSVSEENSMVSQWMDSMENDEEENFMDVFMSYPKNTDNEEVEPMTSMLGETDLSSSPVKSKDAASDTQVAINDSNTETQLMSRMSTLERYLYFIVMKENMVDKFIRHMEISSFMDFLLKIISTDKPKQPTYVILLLKQQRLIEKLLDCLDSSNVSTVQNTSTDFLKALITLSANSNNEIASAIGPNELTRRLVSPGMISKIGLLMAQGGLPLSNCVGILIEIIRKNHSDYDVVQVMQTTVDSNPPDIRDPIYLGNMIKYFARNLPELCAMMKKSLPKDFKTPFGVIEPLGMDRFKVCELVAELLHCSNMALLNEPEGEHIVEERDPLRKEKIYALLKENFLIISNDFDEEDEVQFDMRDTLNTSDNNSLEKVDLYDQNKSESLQESEESISVHLESLNIKSEDNSSDDVSDPTKLQSSISEIDEKEITECEKQTDAKASQSTGEVFGDLDYLQTEAEIRKSPVIGDMLKLAMKDNNVVDAVLEMLFDFPWNNFLHNVVFDIVQQILNGSLQDGINRFLIADLFLESRITELIIAGDQYCQQYEETNKLRLGYMGHLTLIAEEVAKFVSYLEEMNIHMLMPEIEEMLSEKAWVDYSNAVLNEARERYNSNFGDDDAGLMVDGWGTHSFDSDGIVDFSGENEGEENNSLENEYPDVNFRNSVDEMILGRHSDDIHIDIEADEDEEESGERSDDEDENDQKHITKLNQKLSLFDNVDDSENGDVNEDSTIEYVNLNGEVVVTTVKEFLKMNSAATINQSSADNDFKEIKTISNLKKEDSEPFYHKNDNNDNHNKNPINVNHSNDNILMDDSEEDDYIDPNDDGHSYAKTSSLLYGSKNTLVRAMDSITSSDSDEINSSNSDSDNDSDEDNGLSSETHKSTSQIAAEEGRGLCRQMTSDNMKWDESEQQRIFGYKKLHDENL